MRVDSGLWVGLGPQSHEVRNTTKVDNSGTSNDSFERQKSSLEGKPCITATSCQDTPNVSLPNAGNQHAAHGQGHAKVRSENQVSSEYLSPAPMLVSCGSKNKKPELYTLELNDSLTK